jgi:hypothetical protein
MAESLMVERVETSLGRTLTDEERFEVELWDRGRTLAQVVHTEAYIILIDTLRSYADRSTHDLLKLSPGSEHVKEAHAAAYALNDLFVKFQEDINSAVTNSMTTPSVLKNAARMSSPVPPESM